MRLTYDGACHGGGEESPEDCRSSPGIQRIRKGRRVANPGVGYTESQSKRRESRELTWKLAFMALSSKLKLIGIKDFIG